MVREQGFAEAEHFFRSVFEQIYDDTSFFTDVWDTGGTEAPADSLLEFAGQVYSGNAAAVEDMIESGAGERDFERLYLAARYYECQSCLASLKRTMCQLQGIFDSSEDRTSPRFRKYLFRRAFWEEYYFDGDGVATLAALLLDNPGSDEPLLALRRAVLARHGAQVHTEMGLVSALYDRVIPEEVFLGMCRSERKCEKCWGEFIDHIKGMKID